MKKLIVSMFVFTLIFTQTVFSQEAAKQDLQKAKTLLQQGKKEEASAILVKMMGAYPDNKEAVQFWLMANMKRSPTGEQNAIKQLDSLAAIYPKNTGIIFYTTFIQAEYGQSAKALAGFEKLISLQPDSAINWIGKGQILSGMNKSQEALAAFDKATALDPKSFDAWNMKAIELSKAGKYDEAIVSMNKAIEISPKYAAGFYNRACMYCLKGDKINALDNLKKSIEMNPQFRESAVKDQDFSKLWNDVDFKKITQ